LNNDFPRILGTAKNIFEDNIKMVKQNYTIVDQEDILEFTYSDSVFNNLKTGMLITFDDGLSDHYEAAKILAKNNINAIFFIPTCIIKEKLPANPTIIHYCIAKYGIDGFLKFYKISLEKLNLHNKHFLIDFVKEKDDPWNTIKKIKLMFKYTLDYNNARQILIDIYKNSLLKDSPNALELMHLSEYQIKKMLDMGHSLGVHTHTHISVGPTKLSEEDQKLELSEPKKILENKFNTSIKTFSYPFGETDDCLTENALSKYLKEYKLIFTVEEIMNTKNTSPYELGRYQPISTDTTKILEKKLQKIEQGLKN
jgi:peptidoglycan/xylan/chitin deacetylase (PgdA/CDA1 family)